MYKKITLLTLIASVFSLIGFSQIPNNGFDSLVADSSILPWKLRPLAGYSYSIDKTTRHSGTAALKLTSTNSDKSKFIPFSQTLPYEVSELKKIAITAYIKCQDVQIESTLWCQVLDENGKMIGFANLGTQGLKIAGTADWKKYSMPIMVNANAKKLLLGGYLSGTGTAWFDDFQIEEISQNAAPASAEVASYIASFLKIVKENSIYTDSLNWPRLEKAVQVISAGMTKVDEVKPVLDYVISELRNVGDNHSYLQNKVASTQYTQTNSNPTKPESKLLDGGIGYISVPGFSTTNEKISVEFATEIQNMILDLETKNDIKGWIVDLRGNTGGNMYPMIAGLGPLTGEGTLGYFIRMDNKKESSGPWFYKKGSSGAGKHKTVTVSKPYKLKNSNAKVAVLIGPKTSSSGEMTAISFIGKKNAKTFGTLSGGYTTGNASYSLSDGATLLLAASFTADRNQIRYPKKIIPDVLIEVSKQGSDEVLKKSSDWLLSTP